MEQKNKRKDKARFSRRSQARCCWCFVCIVSLALITAIYTTYIHGLCNALSLSLSLPCNGSHLSLDPSVRHVIIHAHLLRTKQLVLFEC